MNPVVAYLRRTTVADMFYYNSMLVICKVIFFFHFYYAKVDEVTEEDELMIECNQCQMFFAQTKLKKHVTQCGRQTQERFVIGDTSSE